MTNNMFQCTGMYSVNFVLLFCDASLTTIFSEISNILQSLLKFYLWATQFLYIKVIWHSAFIVNVMATYLIKLYFVYKFCAEIFLQLFISFRSKYFTLE